MLASEGSGTVDNAVTGLGDTIEEALAEAAGIWAGCVAPPLLSLLAQAPAQDAEWLPSGDPQGLIGWDAYSSAYVMRGDIDEQSLEPLIAHLETQPLLASLQAALLPELDAARPFNTLSCFRGQGGEWVHAECFVNGVASEALSLALQELPWPAVPASQYVSIRQFVVCMRPALED